MLKITVPAGELFDPVSETFIYTKETTLTLEHSLVSLSKWESKWKTPFLNHEHSVLMFDDYIRCMTLTQNVDPNVYRVITPDIRKRIQEYMDDPMTAAIIREDPTNGRVSKEFTTSDLIYYWMVELGISFDCQKWHLNRLLALIRITNIKRKPPKKTNRAEVARRHHDINAARRAKQRSRR